MMVNIKNDNNTFCVRVGAIIYNKEKTHVLLQQPESKKFLLIPGGRLEIGENIDETVARELNEELWIKNEKLSLKYVLETFAKLPKIYYHELGFYYVTTIDENKYGYDIDKEFHSKDEDHDGVSIFKWFKLSELPNYEMIQEGLKDKIINFDDKDNIEHIIYENKAKSN